MADDEVLKEASEMSVARNGEVQELTPSSPAAARRQLGSNLRSLRESVPMTLDDVASRIQRSAATMSRLERGNSKPRLVDVRALLELYDEQAPGSVSEEARSSALDLVQVSRRDDWFTAFRDVLGSTLSSAEMQRFVELETDAQEYLSFEPNFVPGLLQTEGYVTAIADEFLTELGEAGRKRFAEFRIARQRVLDHLRLHVIIGEAALRRPLGTAEVMLEQLHQVAEELRGGRDNVTVQLAPVTMVAPDPTQAPFVLMRVDGGDSDVVYLESRAGAKYLKGQGEIARYEAEFAELSGRAMNQENSLKLVEEVIQSYR